MVFAAGLNLITMSGCAPTSKPIQQSVLNPQRVISLDFCADQYALELLPKTQILALSPDAGSEFSYHKNRAADIPTVRPRAEDILALKPDLIIRSYGGGPNAARLFEAAGVPVVNIGWASELEGEAPGSISYVMRGVANGLGRAQAGDALIEDYKLRLSALKDNAAETSPRPRALYMTPYGVTTGPGSLVHDMIELAGYDNFEPRIGWHPIPLERLASERPDHIITSFFDSHETNTANWSAMRHPLARRALNDAPAISLKGAWTSCGAWFLLDAIETMSLTKDGS